MNKMNVIIVDDEPKCVQTLSLLLNQYYDDIEILDSAHSMSAALEIIEKHKGQIHILFLDIQMPGGDGFAILQRIPDINFKIIFTTAHDQYAIKAIRFSALDYLLKPIDNKELKLALDRFRSFMPAAGVPEHNPINEFKRTLQQKNIFNKLAIPTLTEIKFVELDKVLYLESDNNYTTIHIERKQQLISSKSIGYYEELLVSSHFFRVHNSYLVNLKRISAYIKGRGGHLVLDDGEQIEVSVRKRDELLKMLNLG